MRMRSLLTEISWWLLCRLNHWRQPRRLLTAYDHRLLFGRTDTHSSAVSSLYWKGGRS